MKTGTSIWLCSLSIVLLATTLGAGDCEELVEKYLGERVRVTRENLRPLEGLLKRDGDRIFVNVGYAEVPLDLDHCRGIEALPSVPELLEEKKRACKNDASCLFNVGVWCRVPDILLDEESREFLQNESRELFEAVIRIQPDHENARLELGHIFHDGKWHRPEDYYPLVGYVEVRPGVWLSPAEAEWEDKIAKLPEEIARIWRERRGRPWTTTEVVRTSRFVLKCNSPRRVAAHYRRLVDRLFDLYEREFDVPAVDFRNAVHIFRNKTEFMDFTGQGPFTGGFFRIADKALLLYHGGFGVTGSTEKVLAHELVHLFQDRFLESSHFVPKWVLEGMAVYYGDGLDITGRGRLRLHRTPPRDRVRYLKASLAQGDRYLKVHDLLRANPTEFSGRHYAPAWGLVYWCHRDADGKRVWGQYLEHLREDRDTRTDIHGDAALEAYLKKEAEHFEQLLIQTTEHEDLEAWEKAYRAFIGELTLKDLGRWKGSLWDAERTIGLRISFPRKLKPVKEIENLNADLQEEAAAVLGGNAARLRVWVSVQPNFLQGDSTTPAEAEERARQMIEGQFRDVAFLKEPSADPFGDSELIPMVRATFRGRIATHGGQPGKDYLDVDVSHFVRSALLITPDYLHAIYMSGEDEAIVEMEKEFETMLQSVELSR